MKQIKFASFVALCLFVAAILSNAEELLQNGSFEEPITDDLSRAFSVDQQGIPGWEFSGGDVRLVNHTRLLPGAGFQSLLLPCTANESSAIRQAFNLDQAGPVRIEFKLAASKAVDGTVEVDLDDKGVKSVRLSDFWKPEEIALTDQMKWQSMRLPQIQLAGGRHTLAFRVTHFQPRNDHQGDTREIIQGILLDAISVEKQPYRQPSSVETHPWPAEAPMSSESNGVLSLDAIAGPWVETRTLACYPSVANFAGALRSTKELGGIQYLHFTDVGSVDGVAGSITLDGQPVLGDESRWYPYQICTRTHAGAWNIESTTRMVFAAHGVLNWLALTNPTDGAVARTLEMILPGGIKPGADANTLAGAVPASAAWYFTSPPDEVVPANGKMAVRWRILLPPHAGKGLGQVIALEKTSDAAVRNAQQWGKHFDDSFAAAKSDWAERWQAVFTPGNKVYSGCLPTFETDDQSLRELYYLSTASLLETERDNFSKFKQCFVGEDPEWGGDVTWFWDYSLTSLPYALLNPAVMKNELRFWLTIDWKTCSHFSLYTGRPDGSWYAVNPYAYFLSLDRYLAVNGDSGFLSESVNGRTVLEYMGMLAMDWKRLVPKDERLADIGGNSWNMLEAPPNYVHTVASLNAANIWMMRRQADYQAQFGDPNRAADLRSEANVLVPEVLKLYNPKTGSWNVRYPGGQQIDSRHVYDYLTVGTTISDDLNQDIKTGMMKFVDRELMTPTWMRAMSRQDPSAFDSDRSDHGPAGSYTGWPAKAAQATAELGRFDKALDMFHRFRGAFTAAIPQAVELTRVEGQDGLQARVSTRAGASFAEVSGSFAEVVLNTFFGYRPGLDSKTALWEPQTPRGFSGELHHVRWNDGLYTIISDQHGLRLEKE